MTTNLCRKLANRCYALKATQARSAAGKPASGQNSRKHSLNSAPDFELSPEYQALVDLIAEERFSAFAFADIASGLLNYRPVMHAYFDTYSSPEPVEEFIGDMSVKGSMLIFMEMLSESGSEPYDVRDMAVFSANMQRQERRKGGPVSLRARDTHKLMSYKRNGIARLSKAVRYCPN